MNQVHCHEVARFGASFNGLYSHKAGSSAGLHAFRGQAQIHHTFARAASVGCWNPGHVLRLVLVHGPNIISKRFEVACALLQRLPRRGLRVHYALKCQRSGRRPNIAAIIPHRDGMPIRTAD